MNERTKIDVSLDTFGANRLSHGSINLFQSSLGQARGLTQDMENEVLRSREAAAAS